MIGQTTNNAVHQVHARISRGVEWLKWNLSSEEGLDFTKKVKWPFLLATCVGTSGQTFVPKFLTQIVVLRTWDIV